MNKIVDATQAVREHEGNAISQMHQAIRELETACNAASHGGYDEASKLARSARDRLYFADIELRKAQMMAKKI
jgi:hypothetical protein